MFFLLTDESCIDLIDIVSDLAITLISYNL